MNVDTYLTMLAVVLGGTQAQRLAGPDLVSLVQLAASYSHYQHRLTSLTKIKMAKLTNQRFNAS